MSVKNALTMAAKVPAAESSPLPTAAAVSALLPTDAERALDGINALAGWLSIGVGVVSILIGASALLLTIGGISFGWWLKNQFNSAKDGWKQHFEESKKEFDASRKELEDKFINRLEEEIFSLKKINELAVDEVEKDFRDTVDRITENYRKEIDSILDELKNNPNLKSAFKSLESTIEQSRKSTPSATLPEFSDRLSLENKETAYDKYSTLLLKKHPGRSIREVIDSYTGGYSFDDQSFKHKYLTDFAFSALIRAYYAQKGKYVVSPSVVWHHYVHGERNF